MSFHSTIPFDAQLAAPTLSQSRLYARVLRTMGRDTLRLDLGGAGHGRLILRYVPAFGRIALMPGGPLWRQGVSITTRRDALDDLPFLLRHHGIAALITNCASLVEERILCAAGHLPLLRGGYHAQLDLTGAPETRRTRMHGKWRNRLRHAEQSAISINRARFDPARHAWLLAAEAAQRRARGYRALPIGFASVAAQIAPKQAQLFIASHKGERLGAMLFLLHDGAATYHIGHINDAGRALSAHNLLLWQASVWLGRNGFTRVDLGPVETETAAGLARFKLGSGAEPVPRGASCLYSRATAPIGRFSRTVSRAIAGQTGRSCR